MYDLMYFVQEVKDTIMKFHKQIQAAPVKAYGKDAFGNRKQSQWQVKNARAAALKNIAETAELMGFDVASEFTNFSNLTKTTEEPEE
jgi:hypothetical protein